MVELPANWITSLACCRPEPGDQLYELSSTVMSFTLWRRGESLPALISEYI